MKIENYAIHQKYKSFMHFQYVSLHLPAFINHLFVLKELKLRCFDELF